MILTITLIAISVILLAWVSYLHYHLYKIHRSNKELIKQARGSNLEEILNSQNKWIKKNTQTIKNIQKFAKRLDKRLNFTVQKVKIKRYNAFSGEGGEQSFSLALLDEHNNGVVITNLHSQEGDRIYAKPIKQGESSYHLIQEEKAVIAESKK